MIPLALTDSTAMSASQFGFLFFRPSKRRVLNEIPAMRSDHREARLNVIGDLKQQALGVACVTFALHSKEPRFDPWRKPGFLSLLYFCYYF
ncbi:hypothetical protein CEXT_301781 [Caerostris extrusa]|uniref:Uncharacterized protein n=1 Tax=Caerostris extrusa TaxID=172846 RepID=A0AAV4X8T0_CAEEX|nr:hypothetical protein CEXT_301781 [Caerostris extrusa]